MRYYSNTAQEAELTTGVTASATSLSVSGTTGFPASFPYTLVLDPEVAGEELVEVTAATGNTLTVVRGVDGTAASAHDAGATVRHAHSARDFRESRDHEAATSNVHGVSALVGTTEVQTLTNKNLADPTNTFPTSLVTLTGTQALTNKDLTGVGNLFPSSLATLTGVQTLTNKNLTDASNTFPASLATDSEVNTAVHGGSARTAAPFAKISKSATAQTIPAGSSLVAVTFQVVDEETDASFGDLTNNRLVAPIAGRYRLAGSVNFSVETGQGVRSFYVRVNGASVTGGTGPGSNGVSTALSATTTVRLAAGDLITMEAVSTGEASDLNNAACGTHLEAMWVAP